MYNLEIKSLINGNLNYKVFKEKLTKEEVKKELKKIRKDYKLIGVNDEDIFEIVYTFKKGKEYLTVRIIEVINIGGDLYV